MRTFGLDALGPLTPVEGSRMFPPEVVLSRKIGSIHIFGELSRITGRILFSGWHVIGSPGPENGRQGRFTRAGRGFSAGGQLAMVRSGFCVRRFFQGG